MFHFMDYPPVGGVMEKLIMGQQVDQVTANQLCYY